VLLQLGCITIAAVIIIIILPAAVIHITSCATAAARGV
jgi:hypothetical protein